MKTPSPRLELRSSAPLSQARRGGFAGLFDLGSEVLEDGFEVVEDLFVSESNDFQTSRFEMQGSDGVVLDGFGRVVNCAVQFDDQLGAGAVEINDVAIKCFLTQESNTLELRVPHRLPKLILGSSWRFAVLALKPKHVIWFFTKRSHPITVVLPPSPNPDPQFPLVSPAREGRLSKAQAGVRA